MARTQNNLGKDDREANRARHATATVLPDVTRKQRFGSVPTVSRARRRLSGPATAVASVAPRSGTHTANNRVLRLPECGQSRLRALLNAGGTHVKRTVCEKSTHWNPAIGSGHFLFTGCCGARATIQRRNIREEYAHELRRIGALKRCCSVRRIERGACRVVRLASRNRFSVRFALPRVADSLALRRPHPPSDAGPGVVASAARAVCAGRASFPGSLRRSTKAQLPSSSVTRFHLHRDGAERASNVPVGHGRHFSLTRTRITVAPALGFTGKQWHTR
jgi:hypothetical protein